MNKTVSLLIQLASTARSQFYGFWQAVTFREFLRNPINSITLLVPADSEYDALSKAVAGLGDDRIVIRKAKENDGPKHENEGDTGGILIQSTGDFFLAQPWSLVTLITLEGLPDGVSFSCGGEEVEISAYTNEITAHLLLTAAFMDETNQLNFPKIETVTRRSSERLRRTYRQCFSNPLFWNFRYEANQALGSGVGSRGLNVEVKRLLLNRYVVPLGGSVLDCGCGDLHVAAPLNFGCYTGIDVSAEALKIASAKRPDWTFLQGGIEEGKVQPADIVLCFEVLIHIREEAQLREVVQALGKNAKKRIVVSGYDDPVPSGHMTFFSVPLRELLEELPGWKPPVLACRYENMSVYVVDSQKSDYPAPLPLDVLDVTSILWCALSTLNNETEKNSRSLQQQRTALIQEAATIIRHLKKTEKNDKGILKKILENEERLFRIEPKLQKLPLFLDKIAENEKRLFRIESNVEALLKQLAMVSNKVVENEKRLLSIEENVEKLFEQLTSQL